MVQDLSAQRGQGVFDLATAVPFVDESGQGQPADMLAGGLAPQPGPFPDLPKGQPRLSLEKLEDLNPAMVGHALEDPFQLPANQRVHIGYNREK